MATTPYNQQPWQKLREKVHLISYRTVVAKTFLMPDGTEDEWGVFGDKDRVTVVALTSKLEVIVARQFRPGPEIFFDEIPGGCIEQGQTPEVAVRHELSEETGYNVGELTSLTNSAIPEDSYSQTMCYRFLATNCIPSEFTPTPPQGHDKYIETKLISIDQLINNVYQGKVSDGLCVMLAIRELEKRGLWSGSK